MRLIASILLGFALLAPVASLAEEGGGGGELEVCLYNCDVFHDYCTFTAHTIFTNCHLNVDPNDPDAVDQIVACAEDYDAAKLSCDEDRMFCQISCMFYNIP